MDIPPRVHIIVDDLAVLRSLKRLLGSWGMRVIAFSSGKEFLSSLKGSPDAECAVIDVQMPGMNGLEVQAHMNRSGLDVPVIFITAHDEEGIETRALQAGAVGFLRKPFLEEAIVKLILSAVRNRRQAGALREGRPMEDDGLSPSDSD